MIVDAHVHLGTWPEFKGLGDIIRTTEDTKTWRSRYPELFSTIRTEDPTSNVDELIVDMDRFNIDKAVVMTEVNVTNDLVAAMVAQYPDRLTSLACVGMTIASEAQPDLVDARRRAVVEIERCVESYDVRGIGEILVSSFTRAIHPEEIANDLAPILSAADKYHLPVMFPTAWTQFRGGLYYGDPIFVDEVASAFPHVPIILTKMGRSIGFYYDMAMTVASRNSNVYFDVVGTSPDHLRAAVAAIGADRILFGTDWSFSMRWIREPIPLQELRLSVVDDARLSSSDRESILHLTAESLFHL